MLVQGSGGYMLPCKGCISSFTSADAGFDCMAVRASFENSNEVGSD